MSALVDYEGGGCTAYIACDHGSPSVVVAFRYCPVWDEVEIFPQMNHYLPWHLRILPALRFLLGVSPFGKGLREVVTKRSDIERVVGVFCSVREAHIKKRKEGKRPL